MTAAELRQKYLDFFKSKGHTIIPSASLVPENDPTVLFTTAGMHPLVPYLLGEKHPGGTRVASIQKCVRTGDIDDVGDNRHFTFFEMMGNWSFGDYFKKEAIEWSFEFLTDPKWLGLDPKRIYVTTFKGEDGIPRDEESIAVWKRVFKEKAGMDVEVAGGDETVRGNVRIIPLGKDDNFWIAGETGPCGGDTEMFYDVRPEEGKLEGKFSELVDSFRIMEVWNDVFMEFNKTGPESYEKLEKPNVDTGMGVERTLAILNGQENAFETELFQPLFREIEKISGVEYSECKRSFRIIADHIRAATFIIADGVVPSNTHRGYILRRLIRRAVRHGKFVKIKDNFMAGLAGKVVDTYGGFYGEVRDNKERVFGELEKEENKFRKTLESGLKDAENELIRLGLKELEKEIVKLGYGELHEFDGKSLTDHIPLARIIMKKEKFPGDVAFDLYQNKGLPLEITQEELRRYHKNIEVDVDRFNDLLLKHQALSRTASAGKFKGGLADHSEETTKLHTTAHLLLAALKKVLGDHVVQRGSNITAERLRFDFSHPEKMTDEQKRQTEDLVNEAIRKDLPVKWEEMTLDEAREQGAAGAFESKYGDKVKVYTAGNDDGIFSKEICGGPHVERTGALGSFKIKKEESSSAGVRRIKAVLE